MTISTIDQAQQKIKYRLCDLIDNLTFTRWAKQVSLIMWIHPVYRLDDDSEPTLFVPRDASPEEITRIRGVINSVIKIRKETWENETVYGCNYGPLLSEEQVAQKLYPPDKYPKLPITNIHKTSWINEYRYGLWDI